MREFCPGKQGVSRGLGPNLLILNKGTITPLSLFKPFSSNRVIEKNKSRKDSVALHCKLQLYLYNSPIIKRGAFPTWTCPSFFVLFCPFPNFPGSSRFARGLSGDFPDSSPFLFLGLLKEHLRGTVPKGCATESGLFPKKVGDPPGLETPALASLNSGSLTKIGNTIAAIGPI